MELGAQGLPPGQIEAAASKRGHPLRCADEIERTHQRHAHLGLAGACGLISYPVPAANRSV